MKVFKSILVIFIMTYSFNTFAQDTNTKENYWQAKVDFLEPIVNQGFIIRGDYGTNRHLFELFGGGLGKVSEFDNKQFETFEDKTNFLLGVGYQYFLSAKKQNRGFYVGGDVMFANRTVSSKVSSESVENISVFTPGVTFGWLWKPFKKADFIVDFTIVHPRYDFGDIKKVDFISVNTPYEPKNLFNFLGPWSIGWRF
ncbi:MAG TPA: hypothetical protein PK006_05990 [Saprospiraceae bacterium]|nr:hypothetical protein [Saprospiraceae bacterium]